MSLLQNNINEDTTSKNLWCRDAKANDIIKIIGYNPFRVCRGAHIRECIYGEKCRGSHSREDIKIYPYIQKWSNVDKSTYNFPEMHEDILLSINRDKVKLKSNSYLFNEVSNINRMNFIEVLNLWNNLATYYRKMAKEQNNTNDIPDFHLNEKIEDNAWAFDRLTKFCQMHKSLKEKISQKIPVIIWDICLGETNCKNGCHYLDETICIDDFLTGSCTCTSKVDFDGKRNNIIKFIERKKSELEKTTNENKIKKIQSEIDSKNRELICMQRKIHYTETDMVPYNKQYEEYKNKKRIESENKQKELDKINHKFFEHDLSKNPIAKVGKVIKINFNK